MYPGRSAVPMDRKQHWEHVFAAKGEHDVSWFEALPAISLRMMEAAGLGPETCVLDVGGGDSRVVDALVSRGLDCIAVLDISHTALDRAKARLGNAASALMWIEADIASAWALKPMDIWHDRAVFHFLTDAGDRDRYRQHLKSTLKPAGTAIVATFAPDGPKTCSGLPVMRYSAEALSQELGDEFALVETVPHIHLTPWGTSQSFQYSRFTRTRN
jgi:SAM-dependent methyltransferase